LHSATGDYCAKDLPGEDVPSDQMEEVIGWIMLLSDDFEVVGNGEFRLKEGG
jgi:hypothetical protein